MSESPTQARKEFNIPKELGERLLRGDITVGEFFGLSQRSLYAIANIGHQMLKAHNFEGARDVFEGLVAAAPYDSVFRTHLGATYANLERYDEALEQYTKAINFNYANSDALTGRGELLLRAKRVPEAIRDLQAAVKYDPSNQKASTARARTILTLLQRAVQEARTTKEAGKGEAKAAHHHASSSKHASKSTTGSKPAVKKSGAKAKAPEKKHKAESRAKK